MEHGKLPWKFDGKDVIDADGNLVTLLAYSDDPEFAIANGEFIVEQCNKGKEQ